MLGITALPSISDIIAFGVFALSVAAWVFGGRAGDKAKTVKPADPTTSGIAAGFVDKDLMVRLTMACESIASTLKEAVGIQTDEHERATQQKLDLIAAAVLKRQEDDVRAWDTGDRVERAIRKPRE